MRPINLILMCLVLAYLIVIPAYAQTATLTPDQRNNSVQGFLDFYTNNILVITELEYLAVIVLLVKKIMPKSGKGLF